MFNTGHNYNIVYKEGSNLDAIMNSIIMIIVTIALYIYDNNFTTHYLY